jgi:flagellar motor switch/type III secretory pathway protein FliN
MAAAASPARAMERPPGNPSAEAGAAALNTDAAAGHESGEDRRWRPVLELPGEFMVDLPVPGFTIADLLKLRPGSVINAHWRVGKDAPLRLNGTLIAWGEFEVMGNNLAVRFTELA